MTGRDDEFLDQHGLFYSEVIPQPWFILPQIFHRYHDHYGFHTQFDLDL